MSSLLSRLVKFVFEATATQMSSVLLTPKTSGNIGMVREFQPKVRRRFVFNCFPVVVGLSDFSWNICKPHFLDTSIQIEVEPVIHNFPHRWITDKFLIYRNTKCAITAIRRYIFFGGLVESLFVCLICKQIGDSFVCRQKVTVARYRCSGVTS